MQRKKKTRINKNRRTNKSIFCKFAKTLFFRRQSMQKRRRASSQLVAAALVDSHVSWLQCIHLVYRCLGSLCFVSILYVVGRGGVARRRHEVPRLLLCARQASKLRVLARSHSLLVHGCCCCWLGFGCFGWCKQMACAPKNCCFQLP